MKARLYGNILREAELLSRQEQMALIARLAEALYNTEAPAQIRPRWEDYAGSAPYPLCGEDAQTWVTRARQESDEGRSTA